MRITTLRGIGVTWFKCPSARLTCSPSTVGSDGACPRCGHARMLLLSFGEHPAQPVRNMDRRPAPTGSDSHASTRIRGSDGWLGRNPAAASVSSGDLRAQAISLRR